MALHARALILAVDDEGIGALAGGLDALGWAVTRVGDLGSALAVLRGGLFDAALVQVAALPSDAIAQVRAAADPRCIPVIALGDDGDQGADLAMPVSPHPTQVALRLEQLVRAAVAHEEFRLRRETFAGRGSPLDPRHDAAAPLRILAAGIADRRFLALSNAMTAMGAEVVAAPTPYTAFDYLHESPFDAAVLWGGPEPAPALSIASGMKRNTRLYHIPLMLYLQTPADLDLGDVFNRGFADVVSSDTTEDKAAERLLALARAHRRQLLIRKALESVRALDIMDPLTGLFTPALFAAHLARVSDAARTRRRPLSVCVLRVRQTPTLEAARAGGWLDRALPQIGTMVSRLVRTEDIPARLAREVFALALPATSGPSARVAAERIAAVIGCTAFDAGPNRTPFVAEFEVGTAEMQADEPPSRLLERASANINLSRSI